MQIRTPRSISCCRKSSSSSWGERFDGHARERGTDLEKKKTTIAVEVFAGTIRKAKLANVRVQEMLTNLSSWKGTEKNTVGGRGKREAAAKKEKERTH